MHYPVYKSYQLHHYCSGHVSPLQHRERRRHAHRARHPGGLATGQAAPGASEPRRMESQSQALTATAVRLVLNPVTLQVLGPAAVVDVSDLSP